MQYIARATILGLSTAGLIGVAPIAYRQIAGTAACPALGIVPACYVVFLGYALIAASLIARQRTRTVLFVAGWVPVIILALFSSSLEVFGHEVCPRTASDVPTCFFSLAIGLALAAAFAIDRSMLSALNKY